MWSLLVGLKLYDYFWAFLSFLLPNVYNVRWNNQKGAENICKVLGYKGGTKYTAPGGSGPILAGNRLCSGGEKTIWDCPLQGGRTDTTRCNHDHDQGVRCIGGTKK